MTTFSDADRARYQSLVEAAWSSDAADQQRQAPHRASVEDCVKALRTMVEARAKMLRPRGQLWFRIGPRRPAWEGATFGATGVVLGVLVLILVWLFSWPAHAQKSQLLALISTAADAAAGGKVVCVKPCQVTSVYMTTGPTAGYLMTFDSITMPGDGAVTARVAGSPPGAAAASLVDCIAMPANDTRAISYDTIADVFRVGFTVVFSSTGCYTKTAAATGFFKVRKTP